MADLPIGMGKLCICTSASLRGYWSALQKFRIAICIEVGRERLIHGNCYFILLIKNRLSVIIETIMIDGSHVPNGYET